MIALPTVRFGTDFDPARQAVSVPLTVSAGGHAALAVVDGLIRGEEYVGRFDAESGLVGLKVDAGGRAVVVDMLLRADAHTADAVEHPARLVLVRSQGRTRAATILGRRVGDFTYRTTARVRFTLDAAELDPAGLLVVEVTAWSGAAEDRLRAAAGVRLDSIRITPAGAVTPAGAIAPAGKATGKGLVERGCVAVGAPAADGRAELTDGFFVIAPDAGVTSWRLRALRRRPMPADPILPPLGPPWRRPRTGEAELRMRRKAVLLVRHRIRRVRRRAEQIARHGAARAFRVADRPVAALLGAGMRRDVRSGRLRAEITAAGGAPQPCEVRYAGRRTIVVRVDGQPTDPSVIRLVTPGSHRFRHVWRLVDGRSA